tara:strand:- start:249 stop:638 length:390 start_codon:yes stop_codon:yes gene_type:complete
MTKTDNTPKILTFEEATDEPLQDLKEENEDRVGPYMDDIVDEVYKELEAMVSAVLKKGVDPAKFAAWDLNNGHHSELDYIKIEHKLISECDLEEMFEKHLDYILARDAWERDMDETYDSMIRQWNAGTF